MTFCVENETGEDFPFSIEKIGKMVCEKVLETEGCPFEATVNLLMTDGEGIQLLNREYREIDQVTDVLSFPNLDFEEAGFFQIPKEREVDSFDPDTGELVLGDICICADRMKEQALHYGHSLQREFAFLVAHSMFHLCGYDHMEEAESRIMERKQEEVLEALGITRD